MSRRPRHLLVAAALAALAACGGGDDGTEGADATPTATPTPCASAPPTPETTVSDDLAVEPDIEVADAQPPCDLVVRDVVVGTGEPAVEGAQAQVKYVVAYYDTGDVIDSSWRTGPDHTLPVQVGAGNLIEGFDRGVVGMREGGRRELVVPYELGYGAEGSGPVPPYATLVFVVDLVSVTPPDDAGSSTPAG
ncbi:MAG: FKBP-type peptidyl-prolyl cis-trans isomerase [Actinomycetes bacterium]